VPTVFTALSRRLEVQADLIGCRAVAATLARSSRDSESPRVSESPREPDVADALGERLCPRGVAVFSSALDKIADLNGVPRDRGGWQHYSIDRRTRILEEMSDFPEREARFQHVIRRVKWIILAAAGVGIIGQIIQ
ncbi:MAG: hypothetical protein N2C14_15145, partial [Planctomycetales bacterium]